MFVYLQLNYQLSHDDHIALYSLKQNDDDYDPTVLKHNFKKKQLKSLLIYFFELSHYLETS